MSVCTVCGGEYLYGGGDRHARCRSVEAGRALLDEAVAWVMSDDPDKGPMPPLVARLREQCWAPPVGAAEMAGRRAVAERSVHEAAVEAMAGALWACPRCVGVARKQNAALVASAEVREGLVKCVRLHRDNCYGTEGWTLVHPECFLAALAGTEVAE